MAAIGVVSQASTTYRVAARTSASTVTDWIFPPYTARYATIFLQPTAVTTSIAISLLAADPVSLDDSNIINIAEHAAFTAITGTQSFVFEIGPGLTGIANDVTNAAAADSYVQLNAVLPALLGIRQVNTGSSTYNLTVLFRP